MELHGDNKNRQVPSAAVLRLSTPTAETARPPSAFADVPSTLFSTLSSNKYLYLSQYLLRNAKTATYHLREITDFKLRYPSESRPRFRLAIQILEPKSSPEYFHRFSPSLSLIQPYFAVLLFTTVRLATSAFAAAVTFDLPLREASPRPA